MILSRNLKIKIKTQFFRHFVKIYFFEIVILNNVLTLLQDIQIKVTKSLTSHQIGIKYVKKNSFVTFLFRICKKENA